MNSFPLDSQRDSRRTRALLASLVSLGLFGCKPAGPSPELLAYRKQLNQCRQDLAKDPLVPIVGGGFLDTRRFAFNVPTVRYEDGKCGTDGFQAEFWWTGEKVVPDHPKFTGLSPMHIPKHWTHFNVGALLGNQRKARECKADQNPQKCPELGHKNPGVAPDWPEDLVIKLKKYPGLEIRLNRNAPPEGRWVGLRSFVMSEWPRADGALRVVDCFGLNAHELAKKTNEELSEIDFGNRTAACQVDFWDFQYKGGVARIGTGTEALADIGPALKALQQYLSDSIIREE